MEVMMKKILLVFMIFTFGIFLYQNVELDLLSKEQKKLLLKELNIANQLRQFKNENLNYDLADPTADKNLSNKESSLNQQKAYELQGDSNLPDESFDALSTNPTEASIKNTLNTSLNTGNLDVLTLLQKVRFDDQLEVANILLKRFTFSELNKYRTMVSNGISSDEKETIKQEVMSRLTGEDLVSLKEIAEKYVVEYYPEQQERFDTLANKYLEGQQ